jgi:hypothetical protein
LDTKDFRTIFIVASVVLMLFVISPTLNLLFPFYVNESFSELSILGPNHMAKDYPFNVFLNQEERIFVTVSNHMGESAYYRVCVKIRNQTQSFPSDNEPSLLDPIYEFRVFLLDGGTWEEGVKFNLLEASQSDYTFQVNRFMINNVILGSDFISEWDSEYNGFYFQLFFELSLYDVEVNRFNYYDRGFVGIWLNMTV